MADLAERFLAGESLISLTRWLNDEGVPTSGTAAAWRTSSVRSMLNSGRISGQRMHHGEIVGPGQSTDLEDAELSADGRWLAAVRGYGDTTQIAWYAVAGEARTGAPPPVPDWLCATSALAGLSSPTWAPDSSALAWQEPDGIWTVQPHPTECLQPGLLIPDAGQPDWSAAPLAPAPRTYVADARPRVRGKARVGKVLVVRPGTWTPTPTTIAYRWLRNGKPIARATGPRYRLTKADRGRRVSVRVTATGGGWQAGTATSRPTRRVR